MTQELKPLNRAEEWIAMHANRILLTIAGVVVLGAGVVVFLLVDEQTRLAGVGKAGPCRAAGIDNAECREQARLIFKACSDQPKRCARMYGISVRPWVEPETEDNKPATSPSSTTAIEPEGGDAFQPSTGRQQPGPDKGPRSGGDGDQGQDEEAAPAPSPGVPGPPAPGGGPPAETPGKGGGEAPGGGSSSGVGVEVCVPAVTCIEADLPDPKGLLP